MFLQIVWDVWGILKLTTVSTISSPLLHLVPLPSLITFTRWNAQTQTSLQPKELFVKLAGSSSGLSESRMSWGPKALQSLMQIRARFLKPLYQAQWAAFLIGEFFGVYSSQGFNRNWNPNFCVRIIPRWPHRRLGRYLLLRKRIGLRSSEERGEHWVSP